MNNYVDLVNDGEDCRLIIESLPRVVMLIDYEGNILTWNKSGKDVFGYTAEEVENRKVWFLYSDRSEEDFKRDLEILKNDGSIRECFKSVHKDGASKWIDVKRRKITLNNGLDLVICTGSDITEHVNMRKELRLSKQRIQTILDNTVEGIITIDKKGIIQSFNKASETIFDYSADEVIGQKVNMLMPSPYREEHNQYLEHYLQTGERKIIGIGREVRGMKKDGEIFPMELSVSEVEFNGDTIFTGIVRDISERRRLENEVLQISEEERRKIGRELHDGLGQMLTGLGLIAKNLAKRLKSNELPGADEVQEISEMIREADQQARAMAHGLVHMELEEEGLISALEQLCVRAQHLFNIECRNKLDSKLSIEDKTATLHLYRIVQEAISNAVKHGRATEVKIEMGVSGEYLQLKVIDNGIGFNKARENNNLKGIGMNTMSYRAHMLGGSVDMKETTEGYTVLNCRVPIQEFDNFNRKS